MGNSSDSEISNLIQKHSGTVCPYCSCGLFILCLIVVFILNFIKNCLDVRIICHVLLFYR